MTTMGKVFTNCLVLSGDRLGEGEVHIEGGHIASVHYRGGDDGPAMDLGPAIPPSVPREDLGGKILMCGIIDTHVHFREPGMTDKGDIFTESRSALLGGVTTYVDMPNTNPPTVSLEALDDKLSRAEGRSWSDYCFHIGATNSNFPLLREISSPLSPRWGDFAGIKVFMGSSTGGMLVDDNDTLSRLFSLSGTGKRILVHSEDEAEIRANLALFTGRYGNDIPFRFHSAIRSPLACVKSTRRAIELALKYSTPLHILHVTTAEEIELIREAKKATPLITAETTPSYLYFCDEDYPRLGARLKCNPAVKSPSDRKALREALRDGTIDTVGTDHAPHLAAQKDAPYTSCPSGCPSITQSLPVMLSVCREEGIPLTALPRTMCETPSDLFGMKDRGHMLPGQKADLVIVDPDLRYTVGSEAGKAETSSATIPYRCGWSPYEGETLRGGVVGVYLDGEESVRRGNLLDERPRGRKVCPVPPLS